MKIGLVRRGFSATGGAEAYLVRLARGLTQAGAEPVLVTSAEWPAERWPGREIIRLEGRAPFAFSRAFREANLPVDITLSLERVPGCQVYRAGDGVHAAWLQRRARFEPAWKRWFNKYHPKHLALMALEREVFRSARAVIANSRMVADEIVHWHDYPQARIHIVPNGIESTVPRMDRQAARERMNIPQDTFCALFVGSGWKRKGLKFAIEAMERLDGKGLLLVAGRGPVTRYASSAARFLGSVSDLSALFSAADVFVLPTIYDPFSNACLEALGAGLPVITTNANGFSEIITPGVHGSIVEPGDTIALALALRQWRDLLGCPPVEECRRLAAGYSMERNVAATLKILSSLAKK